MKIHEDCFSDGQIKSKLWCCEELEKIITLHKSYNIWVLGGWNGILPFLLFSRNNIKINQIRSFDLDTDFVKNANTINKVWHMDNWKFLSINKDVNDLDYENEEFCEEPDIIINTSSEHIDSYIWFDTIPNDKIVVIQSNNMILDDHVNLVNNKDELCDKYKMNNLLYNGSLDFNYDTWSFTRFMIIGTK